MSWQRLLATWLRERAGASARATGDRAAHAAKDRAAERASQQLAAACDVAVVFGREREAVGLLDRLSGILATDGAGFRLHVGNLGGRRVVVLASAEQGVDVAEAVRAVIAGHRPGWIIAAGFAAGLSPEVARGDIVFASEAAATDAPPQAIERTVEPAPPRGSRRLHIGRVLSINRPLESSQPQRVELGQTFAALAADAVSWTVAEVCRERLIPCASLSIVREAVGERPPGEVRGVRRQRTLARRMGALAGAVLRRPSSLKDIWNEKEQDLIHADLLAESLVDLIGSWTPDRP